MSFYWVSFWMSLWFNYDQFSHHFRSDFFMIKYPFCHWISYKVLVPEKLYFFTFISETLSLKELVIDWFIFKLVLIEFLTVGLLHQEPDLIFLFRFM